jgi:pyruvate/2-oxoglutarate dehydrogenase complex dihydrolipoamide dehydrogenase (E3) component
MTSRFDSIVIGTGQAGPSLAARLATAGRRVAVIERKFFGGTCVNTGCIPTKAMVASAEAAHVARRAAEFGVDIEGTIKVDMRRVWERTQRISLASRTSLESWQRSFPNITVFMEQASFESARTVRVGDELLEADEIFINVGGRARDPSFPGLADVPFLTNSSMMDLKELPEHLVIIGGSYIGLEFAQMFRRYGSQVTVVEQSPRLLIREDEEVSAAVLELMRSEGVEVRLGAECIKVSGGGSAIMVHADCEGREDQVTGTHLLLAVGRQPNTQDLGLDKAGVKVNEHGYIEVDDQCRTNVPGIWAMGDCNGKGAFTHTAYNDFEIVAANLLDNDPRRISDRILAYALFVDPPLARIGMTQAEAVSAGRKISVGVRPMTRVGRAVEKGETTGFMKVIVDDESKMLLGAAIFGVGGDEAIHCLLDTMYAKAPYTTVTRAVHIHPTVAELLPTVLQDLHPV